MAIKLFISYAHEDKQHKDELIKHLSALQRNGLVESWDDQQITVGQEWDKEIKKALAQAEIVIFLVSADFGYSDYIHDVEIKSALKRYEAGEQIIIPILVRAYDFDSLELNRFQALPSNLEPVTSWDNQDEAWLNVTEGIKQKIYELKGMTSPVESLPIDNPPQPTIAADKKPPTKTSLLNTHHKYTANRTTQDQRFVSYIYQDAPANQKLHFFFMQGGDLQEHKGLYKRFVNKLAGRDADFKTDYKPSDIVVKDFDAIRFPNYMEEEALKIGITSSVLDSLNIPEEEMSKVLNKNLAFALGRSPDLQGLRPKDKVCFFISISETNWKAQLTPNTTRWLIQHFCQRDLPPTAPNFYFFFAVDYDEDNKTIKQELATAMDTAQFTLAFPELEMVTKSDVQEWFAHYDDLWPKRSDRKKTFKKYFADEDEEMYMEDVQFLLLKIINEINKNEIDGNQD